MEVIDALRTPTVINYLRQLPVEATLGEELFPSRDVSELDYKYMVGANNLPVAARVIPFDAEAPVHSRDGVSLVTGSIPPIKRKIRLDERTMQKLYTPRTGTSDVEDAVADIYDDIKLMTESVRTGIEVLRFRAITTGKIEIADDETGVKLTADYGLEAGQLVTCDGTGDNPVIWSNATDRKIMANLQAWADDAETRSGVRPERILMSRRILNIMLEDQTVRDMVWNAASTKRPITEADLIEVLRRMGLPTQIGIYEKKYRSEATAGVRTTTRFLPDNLLIMLPGDKLGDTLFAPTVEALKKVRMGEITFGDAKGVFGEVWETNEPPAHWTKAAALAFPTFPRANEVIIANVLPS
jgi:hypothetical protein